MESLVEMLQARKWAIVSINNKVLQTFERLNDAWEIADKIKGEFSVVPSKEILEKMRIKDKDDYKEKLDRLNEVLDAGPSEPEFNELKDLAILVKEYEKKVYS
ncbi:MAG: hypothetical protein ACOCRX_07395 [Candidatus Woesearchaeota archaeon]